MVSYFNIPVKSVGFNPGYIVASLLLPVVFLAVSGWFVLNRMLKHSPVELMSRKPYGEPFRSQCPVDVQATTTERILGVFVYVVYFLP
jgi:hypothetical protein